jgi:hypothetical protein
MQAQKLWKGQYFSLAQQKIKYIIELAFPIPLSTTGKIERLHLSYNSRQ